MKIRRVGAQMLHAEGRTDRQDTKKLPVAFRNFENAPKNHTSNCHATYIGKL